MRALALSLALTGCAARPLAPPEISTGTLRFERPGATPVSLDVAALRTISAATSWRAFDPYYRKEKGWWAVELKPVLERVFGDALRSDELELQVTALDGYQVLLPLAQALEPGAFLAFADLDGPWEPIGPQRASPGPFYVVWRNEAQQDLTTHPRPWAVARLALVRFDDAYPKTVPPRRDAAIDEGFRLFRQQCLRCHAINREGGRVGPELNVPKNVTEYRDRELLKAWVKNPLQFRYGNMPPFAHLTENQLDAVLAYLSAMREKKLDDGHVGH